MSTIRAAIVGGSGYVGGELLRLLLFHPRVEVSQVTSERLAGEPVGRTHPNLRKLPGLRHLKFCSLDDVESCDVLFLALPHGQAMKNIKPLLQLAPRVIDLSADFRLNDPEGYRKWYGISHPHPEMLSQFVYGIPELHRQEMSSARYVSSAGCNATAVILALFPLFKHHLAELERSVVEVKAGTSQAGNMANPASHHPERSGAIRTYQACGHRHIAEMEQELSFIQPVKIHFTASSIDMVRGIHAVCHVFLTREQTEKEIWQLYRHTYENEPFIRLVKEKKGIFRLPEPKILAGSNYCDIGFELDPANQRLVLISALDNLMKGAAGQAIQAFNIMHGFEEILGLEFPGLHPV